MDADMRETEDAMRRVPWLTYLLVIVCTGAFFYAETAALEADAVVSTRLATADEFVQAHPYLQVPPLLEQRLSAEMAERLRISWMEKRVARSAPALPPRMVQREQRELERMLRSVGLRLERLPTRSHGVRATERAPVTYLSHAFFHAGWPHLLGNLVLLMLLGYFLEGALGAAIFSCVATASMIGAAAIYAAQNPGYDEPFIGLGGLLAGLLGAFVVRFSGSRREVPFGVLIIATTLALALPMWFGLEWAVVRGIGAAPAVVGGFNPSGWALLGGLGSGALAAFFVKRLGLEGRVQSAEVAAELRGGVDPQLERALQERSAGRLDEAFNLLVGVLRRVPDDVEASLALWEVANALGRPRAAKTQILRVIRDEIQRQDSQNAVEHWLEFIACDLGADADPALLLRVAPMLRAAGHTDEAARALRGALERSEGPTATTVAARVAHEALDLDPMTARNAAWRALGSPELDLDERQELESLLSVIEPQVFDEADDEPDAPGFVPVASVSAADLIAPGEDDHSSPPLPETRPDPMELDERNRGLECIVASPGEFDAVGVRIELEGGHKKRLRFDRIEAIAVAAVDGLGPETVLMVDLLLNWMSLADEPLRLIRFRTDRFDPCDRVEGVDDPFQALRRLVESLLEKADAIPLPDLQSARGRPFAAFQSLAKYQADVLMIGDGGS